MWEAQALNMMKAPIVATGSAMMMFAMASATFTGPAAAALFAGGAAVSALGNSINVNPTTGDRILKMDDRAAITTAATALTSFIGGTSAFSQLSDTMKIAFSTTTAAGQASVRYDAEGRSRGISLTSKHGDMHGENALISAAVAAGTSYAGAQMPQGMTQAESYLLGDMLSTATNVGVEYGKQQVWGKDKSGYDALGRPDVGRLGGFAGSLAIAANKDRYENQAMAEAQQAAKEGDKQKALEILKAAGFAEDRRRKLADSMEAKARLEAPVEGGADNFARLLRTAAAGDGRLGPRGAPSSMAAGEQLNKAVADDVRALTRDGEISLGDALVLADKYKVNPAAIFSAANAQNAGALFSQNWSGAYQAQVAKDAESARPPAGPGYREYDVGGRTVRVYDSQQASLVNTIREAHGGGRVTWGHVAGASLAVGGDVLEVAGGALMMIAAGWTGAGAVGGAALMAHGAANAYFDFKNAWAYGMDIGVGQQIPEGFKPEGSVGGKSFGWLGRQMFDGESARLRMELVGEGIDAIPGIIASGGLKGFTSVPRIAAILARLNTAQNVAGMAVAGTQVPAIAGALGSEQGGQAFLPTLTTMLGMLLLGKAPAVAGHMGIRPYKGLADATEGPVVGDGGLLIFGKPLSSVKEEIRGLQAAGVDKATIADYLRTGRFPTSPGLRPTALDTEAELARLTGGNSQEHSFFQGVEVPRGFPHSTRPDVVVNLDALEAKNYVLSTSRGRASLVSNVLTQAESRALQLPSGMRQRVILDMRGQSFTEKQLNLINRMRHRIIQRSNGAIYDVRFMGGQYHTGLYSGL